MKVVCDQCGTKYSIDDRRIAGKSFKVRCKQCAHVILLHDARAALADTPPAGAWHVVTDGTSRQLALDELRRLLAQGELDDRSLVWREGFDDWRELGAVDELRAAPPCTVAPAPGPSQPALVHQRNETSVLFTLGNLARLAAPPPATTSPGSGGEGSGLLDIQSLARSLASVRSERPGTDGPVFGELVFTEPAVLVPRPVPARNRRLVWGLAASVGALAIASAVLVVIIVRGAGPAPIEASHAGPAPVEVSRAEAPHAEAPHADASHADASHADASHADASHAEVSHAEASHAGPSPADASRPDASHAHAGASHAHASPLDPSHPRPVRSDGSPADTLHADASHIAPAGGASPGHRGVAGTAGAPAERPAEACSEVTCVVGGYADPCCAIYRPHAGTAGPASPSPGAGLPEGLDRPAIAAGLARINTSDCRNQSPARGDVAVSVKVSPAGTVTAVTVRSSPDPALATCVTAAVRAGSFAATQHGGSFAYVWRF